MARPYFASLDEDGWTLDDGEKAYAEHPDMFWIPSQQERHSLKAGDLAKLRFVLALIDEEENEEEAAERMWVEVEERFEGAYRGVLRNQPVSTDEVLLGMEVWFEPRHVIDITSAEEQEREKSDQ